jgi:hypothetical protein
LALQAAKKWWNKKSTLKFKITILSINLFKLTCRQKSIRTNAKFSNKVQLDTLRSPLSRSRWLRSVWVCLRPRWKLRILDFPQSRKIIWANSTGVESTNKWRRNRVCVLIITHRTLKDLIEKLNDEDHS